MEWSVKEALKRVGEDFTFTWTGPLPPDAFGGQAVTFTENAYITATYRFDGKAILVEGEGEVFLARECARCTEPFTERLAVPFSERFSREDALLIEGGAAKRRGETALPENDESRLLTGDRLDFLQAFLDNLYLQLPIVAVCGLDCKGLCPFCGANLSREECSCGVNLHNNAFSALSALYLDNKEV